MGNAGNGCALTDLGGNPSSLCLVGEGVGGACFGRVLNEGLLAVRLGGDLCFGGCGDRVDVDNKSFIACAAASVHPDLFNNRELRDPLACDPCASA